MQIGRLGSKETEIASGSAQRRLVPGTFQSREAAQGLFFKSVAAATKKSISRDSRRQPRKGTNLYPWSFFWTWSDLKTIGHGGNETRKGWPLSPFWICLCCPGKMMLPTIQSKGISGGFWLERKGHCWNLFEIPWIMPTGKKHGPESTIALLMLGHEDGSGDRWWWYSDDSVGDGGDDYVSQWVMVALDMCV